MNLEDLSKEEIDALVEFDIFGEEIKNIKGWWYVKETNKRPREFSSDENWSLFLLEYVRSNWTVEMSTEMYREIQKQVEALDMFLDRSNSSYILKCRRDSEPRMIAIACLMVHRRHNDGGMDK